MVTEGEKRMSEKTNNNTDLIAEYKELVRHLRAEIERLEKRVAQLEDDRLKLAKKLSEEQDRPITITVPPSPPPQIIPIMPTPSPLPSYPGYPFGPTFISCTVSQSKDSGV